MAHRTYILGLSVLVLLGAVLAHGPARAEVANGTVFGDWTISCTAETTTRTICALTQTVVTTENGRFLAEIGLNTVSEAGTTAIVMVLRTPSAMLLPVQPAFRVGSRDPVTLAWRTCAGDFCTAVQVLAPEDVTALRAARSMILGYQSVADTSPVTFSVSLSGVTAGLTALTKP